MTIYRCQCKNVITAAVKINPPKVNLMNNNDFSGPFVMQHIEHSVISLHFKR